MRKTILLGLLLACATVAAKPLVTVTCDSPKGVTEAYGIQPGEKPDRPLTLKTPGPDGYQSKPTLILDSGLKKLSVLWVAAGADLEQQDAAKKFGVPVSQPGADEFNVVSYSPDMIVAISLSEYVYGTVTYTLYPKLGAMFMTVQYLEVDLKRAVQSFYFAKCDFSWARLQ
jgi:hypothetical protein